MSRLLALFVLVVLAPLSSCAPSRATAPGPVSDRSALPTLRGVWNWAMLDCDDNPFTLAASPDAGTLILTYRDADSAGQRVHEYRVIEAADTRVRGEITAETRKNESSQPVVWDFMLHGRDVFCWRNTIWTETGCTPPVRRCELRASEGPATAIARAAALAFVAPDTIAGFTRISGGPLEPSGMKLRYTAASGQAIDVFIYPFQPSPGCARACDSIAVDGTADSFADLIPEMIRQGHYEALAVHSNERADVTTAKRVLRGRHLSLRGAAKLGPIRSEMYVYGLGEVLVKTRSTFSQDASGAEGAARFSDAFARRMADPRRTAGKAGS